jgi:hypothetical protein
MIWKRFALLVFIGCGSWAQGKEPPAFDATAEIRIIERLLPAGWKVAERSDAAVPRGLVNREKGVYLKLVGTQELYGRELLNGVPHRSPSGVEKIELWIMPATFRPKQPSFLGKGWPLRVIEDFTAAEADNPRFKLFVEHYTDTPTWPTWGRDVYRALKVVPAGYSRLLISG